MMRMLKHLVHASLSLFAFVFIFFAGSTTETSGGFVWGVGYSKSIEIQNGWPFTYLTRTVELPSQEAVTTIWCGNRVVSYRGFFLNCLFVFLVMCCLFPDWAVQRLNISKWFFRTMVFAIMIGICVTPCGIALKQNLEENVIGDQLASLDCEVAFEDAEPTVIKRLRLGWILPETLATNIVSVHAIRTDFGSKILQLAGRLNSMKCLKLVESEVTCDDLSKFSLSQAGQRISELSLSKSKFDGCKWLPNLNSLNVLDFSCTRIDDCCVDALTDCQNLEHLDVSSTLLDYIELSRICKMRLKTLDATDCQISKEDIQKLRENCQIEIFSSFDKTVYDEVNEILDEIEKQVLDSSH